ncbi:hypothetical protein GPU89_26645 [Burkholderia cepacia]|nr:hypothetical protein [Burkholderia cepacia]
MIYVGTFAKVLAPGLRIGFLIAPPGLAGAFAHARALVDRQSPTPLQVTLAEFIGEGHFATHLRRMRMLYGERRDALLAALECHCADVLDWGPRPTPACISSRSCVARLRRTRISRCGRPRRHSGCRLHRCRRTTVAVARPGS